MKEACSGRIYAQIHQVPEGLEIDNDTYLAGALHFKLKEIEVYAVSGDLKEFNA